MRKLYGEAAGGSGIEIIIHYLALAGSGSTLD